MWNPFKKKHPVMPEPLTDLSNTRKGRTGLQADYDKQLFQKQKVLEYLRTHDSLTPKEALRHLGVYRVASYVNTLKREGYEIDNINARPKYACYVLQFDPDRPY